MNVTSTTGGKPIPASIVIAIVALSGVLQAQGGALLTRWPAAVDRSPLFEAQVDGRQADVLFVSAKRLVKPGIDKETESWVSFAAAGPVTVRVGFKLGQIKEATLYDGMGEQVGFQKQGRALAFRAKPGRDYFVTVNRRYDDRLYLFVEAPRDVSAVPRAGMPGVMVADPELSQDELTRAVAEATPQTLLFERGVYDIGAGFPLAPNQMIYIADGAYVKGTLRCPQSGAEGASVIGRGVLSGEAFYGGAGNNPYHLPRPVKYANHHIYLGGDNRESCDNQTVSGVTLIYSPSAAIVGTGANLRIERVKIFGNYYDAACKGIAVGSKARVEGCFLSTSGAQFRCVGSETTFKSNTFYGRSYKKAKQVLVDFGTGRPLGLLKNVSVDGLTILDLSNHRSSNFFIELGAYDVSVRRNYRFENLRFIALPGQEKLGSKLMRCAAPYSPYRRDSDLALIKNVTLDKVSFVGADLSEDYEPNINVFGWADNARVEGVAIGQITVNGQSTKPGLRVEGFAKGVVAK